MQGIGGKVNSTFNIQQGTFNVQLGAGSFCVNKAFSDFVFLWRK